MARKNNAATAAVGVMLATILAFCSVMEGREERYRNLLELSAEDEVFVYPWVCDGYRCEVIEITYAPEKVGTNTFTRKVVIERIATSAKKGANQ